MAKQKKKIVIVDDHPIILEGIVRLLENEDNLDICGTAETYNEALDLVVESQPDMVLTDITLPDRSGLELIKEIITRRPETLIIVVSMHDEKSYVERVIRAGARGYIMKGAAARYLIEAIDIVLQGGIYLSEEAAQQHANLKDVSQKNNHQSIVERLTRREFEIFQQTGLGKSVREMGEQLDISLRTVHAHRSSIKKKLNLKDGNELVHFSARWMDGVRP